MATTPDTQRPDGATGPEFWRGLEQMTDSPEFREMLAREFPDDFDKWADPVTRRQFLTLAGASLALAGLAGCSPRPAPERKILPYTTQPTQVTPGVPLFFATAMPIHGQAVGVLVRSNEGRPTKIEGNPSHPASLGATDVYTQGSLLGLYDPDRSQFVTLRGESRPWDELVGELRTRLYGARGLRTRGGANLRILTETVSSPSFVAQVEALLKVFPDAKWVQYDPAGPHAAREGARRAFGRHVNTEYDFKAAKVVLALDADFLHCGPASIRHSRDFAATRRVRAHGDDGVKPEQMSRLYAVESMLTSTGAVADHRLPIKSGDVEAFARALAAKLGVAGAPAAGQLPDAARAWIDPLAKDLSANKGGSVVIAGETQPASVHALVHAINDALGNTGKTVFYHDPVEARPSDQTADLKQLVADMNAPGRVEVLLILGGNPVYNAPADLDFAAALDKVPFKVHLGLYQDETATLCEWHVNEAHYLESWGDVRAYDGTVTILQPLIAPLYNGKTASELIAAIQPEPPGQPLRTLSARDVVTEHWQRAFAERKKDGDFDAFWQRALQNGVVPDTALARRTDLKLAGNWATGDTAPPNRSGTEINFRTDPAVFDGRFANNGWLQELPKPITKLTWENVAIMSPRTAEKFGLSNPFPRWTAGERGRAETDTVELKYRGRTVRAVAWILPGHADDSVTVHFGYGRERAGRVGSNLGFNAYKLRGSDVAGFDGGLEVTKVNEKAIAACTQMHHSMEDRKPIRHGTLEEYKKHPDFAKVPPAAAGETELIYKNVPGSGGNGHAPKGHHDEAKPSDAKHAHKHDERLVPLDLYENMTKHQNEYPRKWAMVIDLGVCTDCSACVVACVAENNTPVVGKVEVTRGREMHWLRIDRYFRVKGQTSDRDANDANRAEYIKDPARVETYLQPVLCQQCEKAPCELVCPVAATVHSADGLNDMVYNRCVGTRYCSNNCPYKVRRFNFLTYSDWATESLKLGRNPDVTVRSRGVMEKCTYCVQRIRAAEIEAEREHRPIADGEVVTACQAACPSGAIVFGDLGDEKSAVRKLKAEPSNYALLGELNTMPRTTYLAALRNPNPEMPKGA